MATLPDQIVTEIAFTTDPFSSSPTWTDVSAYVDGTSPVTIKRGRTYELDDAQPGTLSLTFNNPDGRFTPGLSTGAYHPNVIPGRRIRVRAVHSSVTYYLFDGFIDSWTGVYDQVARKKLMRVAVEATDRFKQLGRYSKLRSQLEQEILASGPTSYYPLTEADEDANEAGNVSQLQVQGALVAQQAGSGGTLLLGSNPGEGPTDDGQSTLRLTPVNATNGKYLSRAQATFGETADGLTVGIHLRTTVTGRTAFTIGTGPQTVNRLFVELDGSGHVSAELTDIDWSFPTHTVTSSTVVNDNTTYFVAVVLDCGTGAASPQMRIYVDGTLEDSIGVSDMTTVPSFNRAYVGYQHGVNADAAAVNLWSGDLSHFFISPRVLTEQDLFLIYAAGQAGLVNTLSGFRAERLVNYADYTIPALNANSDFESGVTSWTGTGGATITQSSDVSVHTAGFSAKITPDGVTAFPAIQSEEIPVTPGVSYLARGYFYDTGGNDISVGIRWYDSSHVQIDTTSDLFTYPSNTWEFLQVREDAPTSAAYARLIGFISGTVPASDVVYVDDMQLLTGFDEGNSTMGKQILTGKNVLDALREIVTAEDGLVFVDGAGIIRFVQRDRRWSQAASFTVTASQINPDVDFTLDETLLVNDVRATSGSGTQVRATDQTSMAAHGPFEVELDTLLYNSDDTYNRAAALVATLAEPESRSGAITINAYARPSLYPSILGSELGQRFTVTGMPATAPASTLDLVIESLQHVITEESWNTTYECTPGSHLNYWSLDDATFGKVGLNRLAW